MRSRFEELEAGLVASVRAGLSLEDAALKAGVSVNTVRGWAREGRKRPEGRFAGFAAVLDAAPRRSRAATTSWFPREPTLGDSTMAESQMAWDEFQAHLATAVRAGNTQAMKLYADLHRATAEERPKASDALTALDELAAARQSRRQRAAG